MPTADDIKDAAAQVAEDAIASASNDLGSVTNMDPEKMLNVADRVANNSAASTPHRGIRFTRCVLPGRS